MFNVMRSGWSRQPPSLRAGFRFLRLTAELKTAWSTGLGTMLLFIVCIDTHIQYTDMLCTCMHCSGASFETADINRKPLNTKTPYIINWALEYRTLILFS